MTDEHAAHPEQAASSENGQDAASGDEIAKTTASAAASAYQKTAEAAQAADAAASDTGAGDVAKLAKERDQYLELAQRTKAEFDNYRKRMAREREQLKRESLSNFLKEFLGAFDDLDRTVAEGEKTQDYAALHEGVKLVRTNLWKAMEKAGVKAIDALAAPFDPKFHEAMAMIPSPVHEPGVVMEVFQQGYILDDFVLRHARVIVAAQPPAPAAPETPSGDNAGS